MGKRHNPRHGSMQFWPRKRAARAFARVRGKLPTKDTFSLFAGYKAGMTQVIATDARKHSNTKGEDIAIPVTIIEVPPIKIIGARTHKAIGYGTGAKKTIYFDKAAQKHLGAGIKLGKPEDLEGEFNIILMTQPTFKKTPEIFEAPYNGSKEDFITFYKDHKELKISDVYKEGDYFDTRAVTKGKGFQGPVKRFGVSLRSHKSEKTKRGPGSLGGWISQQHTMYRIAHAGQMGYHQRTHFNNQILKISDNPEEVNQNGGIPRYGLVKSSYILVKGSIQGSKKRLITMTKPLRQTRNDPVPTIQLIIKENAQG